MQAVVERHRRACDGFAAVADQVRDDQWGAPSPCDEWTARDVVEHVIGFHEVLLLRPLGVKVERPKHDVPRRWSVTCNALFAELDDSTLTRRVTALPSADEFEIESVLPALSTDVLVHTWDLARAAGLDVRLDAELVALADVFARTMNTERAGGMYAPPQPMPDDADLQTRMLARLGRRV